MKTLDDVINAVQHETQLSRSQLSLKIGKSRNYLNTTVKNGLSYEKEQEVISLLLDLVDDEVEMLRNVLADKEETIKEKNDEIATKNLFIDGLDMENKGLMDRISKLENNLKHMERVKDKSCELNDKLIRDSKKFTSKISDLKKDISVTLDNEKSLQRNIDSLAKAEHTTGKQLNKETTKNRILTASVIGLVAIFSVYLWVK